MLKKKMFHKTATQRVGNYLEIYNDSQEIGNDGNEQGDKMIKQILNGLYSSSNVNLHKFRDYDSKLSNYIKLKE
jgi:hypothetical protein